MFCCNILIAALETAHIVGGDMSVIETAVDIAILIITFFALAVNQIVH